MYIVTRYIGARVHCSMMLLCVYGVYIVNQYAHIIASLNNKHVHQLTFENISYIYTHKYIGARVPENTGVNYGLIVA